ncbi:hypothetical protein MTP99_010293 [Tenebrio molitor]|nr:hypothetical protein MTP99_010293 [Tenebrio molitor]
MTCVTALVSLDNLSRKLPRDFSHLIIAARRPSRLVHRDCCNETGQSEESRRDQYSQQRQPDLLAVLVHLFDSSVVPNVPNRCVASSPCVEQRVHPGRRRERMQQSRSFTLTHIGIEDFVPSTRRYQGNAFVTPLVPRKTAAATSSL